MSVAVERENHWASLAASALVAVVVGFASTVLVVMQAADAVHANQAQKISWALVLCLCTGGVCLYLSSRHKMPIIIAWSTPGAVLVAGSAQGLSYNQALGAFALAGILTVATGLVKPLARAIEAMPAAIASAMLGGVLLSWVMHVPAAALASPYQVLPLVVAFFLLRLWKPLWTIPVIVVMGLAIAAFSGQLSFAATDLALALPTFDMPQFTFASIVSLGIPLFLVTMAAQNLTGFAVMRSFGYQPPVSSCLVTNGLVSALISPMAGPQINMAAITASLGAGPDAHPDPAQRWKVSIFYFAFYALIAAMAGFFVKVLGALSIDLVHAIAGLALFSPLMGAMHQMMKEIKDIEAALVTFLITASGVEIAGIGAPFWGLAIGLALWAAKKQMERK
ncbi:MAG: benzoate/H(+) symporter BenE family transporter [Pseudomonadota bacterium]|nr:benzoate/H(+) symporter BenE family transporter [Pseudomonadota bacterium]